jgi:hypothetical protein
MRPRAARRFQVSRTFLTFGDIAGKLHMLRIECTRCARKGSYSVAKLLAQHGHRGNMSKWVSDLSASVQRRPSGRRFGRYPPGSTGPTPHPPGDPPRELKFQRKTCAVAPRAGDRPVIGRPIPY